VTENFAEEVQSIVGPLLADLGFVLDSVNNFDEGGRPGSVVYYRSPDCKIQIYSSSRQGSINCMIAPLNAPNQFGLSDQYSQWHFINEFSPAPKASLEELAKTISYKAKSDSQLLEEVRDRIAENYNDAHAGILKMSGGH
jgi:hypothetical protein